jgi:hypothetical protein
MKLDKEVKYTTIPKRTARMQHKHLLFINKLNNGIVYLNQKINLTSERKSEYQENSVRFAEQMTSSSRYYQSKRNGGNLERIIQQIIFSKNAEQVVYCYLANIGFPVDEKIIEKMFEIRYGGKKGWEPDLEYNLIDKNYPDIHIKSCDGQTRNFLKNNGNNKAEYSWLFQAGSNGTDEIFDEEKDDEIVVFIYLDGLDDIIIHSAGRMRFIRKILRDPLSLKHRGSKLAVYSNDLIDLFKSALEGVI